MAYKGPYLTRYVITDKRIITQHFQCGECRYFNGVVAPTEKAARRAWNKSLIGQLRERYSDIINHRQVVINFMDILSRMFGGDQ